MKVVLIFIIKTSNLVKLYNLKDLTRNISSIMTKHTGVQRSLRRFAYFIIQIILFYQS